MLRRATDVIGRARERIRIARDHDPHAWHDGDGHGSGGSRRGSVSPPEPAHDDDQDSFEKRYGDEGPDYDDLPDDAQDLLPDDAQDDALDDQDGGGATRPPLGSPHPGAPDLGGVSPSGVSGPPAGGRRPSAAERRRLARRRDPRAPAEETVPTGLRTTAAWSW